MVQEVEVDQEQHGQQTSSNGVIYDISKLYERRNPEMSGEPLHLIHLQKDGT